MEAKDRERATTPRVVTLISGGKSRGVQDLLAHSIARSEAVVKLNGQCHMSISEAQALELQREHYELIQEVYPDPGAMADVARLRCEHFGLVRWVNGGAVLVHIGGEFNHSWCPVCDGGALPKDEPKAYVASGEQVARIDFTTLSDGRVIVQKLRCDANGRILRAIPITHEVKADFDLDKALDWCTSNGFAVRRWNGGARAWWGDKPTPVRTVGQIQKKRAQKPCAQMDFAYDG